MDPVEIRVAIPAADPPDNISHVPVHDAAPKRRLTVRIVADLSP